MQIQGLKEGRRLFLSPVTVSPVTAVGWLCARRLCRSCGFCRRCRRSSVPHAAPLAPTISGAARPILHGQHLPLSASEPCLAARVRCGYEQGEPEVLGRPPPPPGGVVDTCSKFPPPPPLGRRARRGVCVCSMLPSRTLQQDGIRGVPGGNWLPPLLFLTSPFPHWGFLGSFHIPVSGSPFGGTRTKIPFSGCHHALGSPRVTAKWEDESLVPFLEVQNRHLKLLRACHWSHDHTEWPGQLGNVVPPPAGMLVDTAVPSAQAIARGSEVDNLYSRSA